MITRNLNTLESREFWAAAERAARRVETWPAWKLGQIEPRRAESMATKKEVWLNNRGEMANCEFDALCADLDHASKLVMARGGVPDSGGYLSYGVVAAIDALHEYAHRGDKASNAHKPLHYPPGVRGFSAKPEASTTVLPEGVPPELDDWVKRWDWITARVSVDALRELRVGDEVRIGARWCEVTERDIDGVWVGIVRDLQTEFDPRELAAIANEVRYNGR